MTKANITIPQPCHENWEAMTSVEKGKFCNSCQKNVFDFTASTDREILNAFQKDNNLCGRFLDSQLNRDLVKPKEKNPLWLATTSALISFVGLGTHEAQAQEKGKAKVEQTERIIIGKRAAPMVETDSILVSGIVYDKNKNPMPNLGIYVKGYKVGETNINGNFSIYTHLRARLVFRNADDDDNEATDFYVKNNRNSNIEINQVEYITVNRSCTVGAIVSIKKRTFFGRIFHRIGNLFR